MAILKAHKAQFTAVVSVKTSDGEDEFEAIFDRPNLEQRGALRKHWEAVNSKPDLTIAELDDEYRNMLSQYWVGVNKLNDEAGKPIKFDDAQPAIFESLPYLRATANAFTSRIDNFPVEQVGNLSNSATTGDEETA